MNTIIQVKKTINCNIFAKDYVLNKLEKVFVINEIKSTVPCVVSDLSSEKVVKTLYEKDLKKKNEIEFRIENVIKKNVDKLYVKWNSCDNLFNSWIDEKRHFHI